MRDDGRVHQFDPTSGGGYVSHEPDIDGSVALFLGILCLALSLFSAKPAQAGWFGSLCRSPQSLVAE